MATRAVRPVRLLLVGAGNVGRRFLELLVLKRQPLHRLGLELTVVGVADKSGVAACPDGLDPQAIAGLKAAGLGVARCVPWGRPGVTALEMVQATPADVLLDASPGNLHDGQPGLGCIEAALARGLHVVTANKAPLVLAFPRLTALARDKGVQLAFDATVAGGLPAVALGQRDLSAVHIDRLEGILNLTTNYILTRMADPNRLSYGEALAQAQAAGHAESDPCLDVDGWDAAEKLVILAHSVLGSSATLEAVSVRGIRRVTREMLEAAASRGQRIKPLALAEYCGGSQGYRLEVGPVSLPADHPLAQLGAEQMGLVYHTDVCGAIMASIVEATPMPTAYAMLRDVLSIYR